ncbi:gamma-butyrobetaine dioxygenase [Ambystoma mexicanum]|uniref:gamma-butyrobetaine dioxygenase n=1 Tax=Ambystoma mexicanum TaxID=8296 RepID=UPI0037E8F416
MWTAVVKNLLKIKNHHHFARRLLRVRKAKFHPLGHPLSGTRLQHTAGATQPTNSFNLSFGIQKAEALDAKRFLRIQWEDDSESFYPYVWLRDNCQCPDCFLHSAKARKLPFTDLNVETGVQGIALSNTEKVRVTWPDGHTSDFEAGWLKKRCFSRHSRAEMQDELHLPECQFWGSDLQMPVMSYEDVLSNDESTFKWLTTLKKVGIVLLDGAPTSKGELVRLGKRIGFLRLTFYGHTFQVEDKMDANNVAYTSGKLSLHTDYPALQYPPGVQFLHCLKQAELGGESEVIDGFHVCNQLREQNPEAFHVLSSTVVDFTDIGVDYCDFALQSKQHIIELGNNKQIIRINFNNATRDSVLDVPLETVQPFYSALREFVTLMNRPEHTFCYKMKPGHIVTFDNWRILHGRRSYQSGERMHRHLEGCYLDWDVVMSRMRRLKHSLHGAEN